MRRIIERDIDEWMGYPGRKPLVLRGARQVGKTWVVREAAARHGLKLVELNFEKNPELASAFDSNDVRRILQNIEILLDVEIDEDAALLFLDEIQEFPALLEKLRWFYEDAPDLPVVAAGSLLEFVMEEHDFSMPVGRVTYMYLEPMSFVEFLWALGNDRMADALAAVDPRDGLAAPIHDKALNLFRQYSIVGGMPAAVLEWATTSDLRSVGCIQRDLLQTYRDDFNKYRKHVPSEVLRHTLESVARQLGGKFKYSEVDSDARSQVVKKALDLLVLARICKKVTCSAGNGVPLGAESKEKLFDCILLDVGLVMAQLGLRPLNAEQFEGVVWANKGALAEQMVGQLICAAACPDDERLFFWEKGGSRGAQVDYLLQIDGAVVPVEVKSGASGSMKSLHSFMAAKGLGRAVRLDTNAPSVQALRVETTAGEPVEYELLSLPLYMTEFIEPVFRRFVS